jgi:uncharacterized membrane protein
LKIKLLNGLLIIDILTVFLILAVVFIPSSIARVVLGLPFLLFFPGYTLVAALFARKEGMDGIERIALSFGMSIAVTALIGLGLNYTSWGIRLEPVLYSMAAFIIVLSGVAIIRRRQFGQTKFTMEFTAKLPGWQGSTLNKSLTVILVVAIIGAIGVLVYTVAFPKVGERFTEFYILGTGGKAENYPAAFDITNNQVTGVKYGDAEKATADKLGKVILGIVNQEQQPTTYIVAIQIDGRQVNINQGGQSLNRLGPIELQQGGKWEQEIAFAPQHTGDNQKVEFRLYKDGATEAQLTLHLWVDVKG